MGSRLTAREDKFCRAVVENGGDKVAAYKAAGYSTNMTSTKISIQADKMYNKPKLNLIITNLQKQADEVAKEKFCISVEKRLKWLDEIVKAGLEKQVIMKGDTMIEQRENLAASNQAIKTLNEMLGVDEGSGKAKPVKVFIGVQDAS